MADPIQTAVADVSKVEAFIAKVKALVAAGYKPFGIGFGVGFALGLVSRYL
jgi:hypothetical protein